uniref:Uncharacterized protein n=1 Tax=Zea mays TaxID=4577 RepID=A0A804NJS5_MAIZE
RGRSAGVLNLLQPEGAGFPEHGHELAGEVQSHDPVGPADEVTAHEHRRHGGGRRRAAPAAAAEPPGQLPLHLHAPGVPVQVVHRRVDAQAAQQRRHHVAHAAVARREHHHRALRRQPRHVVHCHPLLCCCLFTGRF